MEPDLAGRIEAICGSAPRTSIGLSGGDFATAYRCALADGRVVFAKTHPDPPSGFFSTEAFGLAWLAEAGHGNVAAVLGYSDDRPACLVLEWIDVGGSSSAAGEENFGRQLALIHAAGAPSFGREDGRTTGSQALPNEPCETWMEFYSTRRLLPLAAIAEQRGALPEPAIARVREVAQRLEGFGGSEEGPARLHGDLWAGNRVVDKAGASWLIDPAAHGGHREFDLAMMRLFGGFGAGCFAAYNEVHPLAPGWERRVPLHQLAPLIVHAIKFGGGYVSATLAALDELI